MAKTLELIFETTNGKNSKITLESPIEPIEQEAVSNVMEAVIHANIFYGNNGELASAKGIRLVERNVTEYEL